MANDVFFTNPFEIASDEEKHLEAGRIQEIVDLTVQLLKKRYPSPMQILRGVHAKSHGCVDATFEVLPKIDECLRVGLFARPATYHAVVRYSNASTLIAHDLDGGENGSRGMAIKVRDVDGDVLLKDNGRSSQDFLMINSPMFAFANVEDYLTLNRILLANNDVGALFFAPLAAAQTNPPTDPLKLAELGRIAQSFAAVTQIKATAVGNPLESDYHSGAPFLFGADRCMHFSVVPRGAKKPPKLPQSVSFDYLREALQKTMAGKKDVVYDFRVQVRNQGETDLFIEDATKFWDEEKYPPRTVARVTIPTPQTGLDTPEHLQECEDLVFTPWHALAAHQPVGGINRLRYSVYVASAAHRLDQRAKPKKTKKEQTKKEHSKKEKTKKEKRNKGEKS